MVNLLAMAFGLSHEFPRDITHHEDKSRIFGNRGKKRGRFGKCKNQPNDYYEQKA